MADHPHFSKHVAERLERSREIARISDELLSRSKPDTFVGRKIQAPKDPMQRPDIQNLINSELQPPK